MIYSLVSHPSHEETRVRSHTRNCYSAVCIDFEQFLLVRSQFRQRTLQRAEYGVAFGFDSNASGSHLHRFHRILHLMHASLGTPYSDAVVVLVLVHLELRMTILCKSAKSSRAPDLTNFFFVTAKKIGKIKNSVQGGDRTLDLAINSRAL